MTGPTPAGTPYSFSAVALSLAIAVATVAASAARALDIGLHLGKFRLAVVGGGKDGVADVAGRADLDHLGVERHGAEQNQNRGAGK